MFLDWARLKGPMSSECQELNRLFSTCVDGIRIKIPPRLESPKQPSENSPPFILDTLQVSAKAWIRTLQRNNLPSFDGYTFNAMELLLSRDDIAISEFELLKLTHRWCRKNDTSLEDLLYLFDLNLFTAEEKHWALDHFPHTRETASIVLNSLCRYAYCNTLFLLQD